MKKVIILAIITLIFPTIARAYSNDVLHGDDMADEGEIIEKTGLAISPHVELEYRLEDVAIAGVSSSSTYPALAYGICFKYGKNAFDFYSRTPLQGNSNDSKYIDLSDSSVYGLSYARTWPMGSNSLVYLNTSLEYRDTEIKRQAITGEEKFKKDTYGIKPSIGYAKVGKNFSNVMGFGIIVDYGDVSADYYDSYKRRRVFGDGKTLGLGAFVQNKASINITESLSIPISLYADLGTSIIDPEIDGSNDSIDSYYFNIGIRIGVQYRF